MKISIAFFLLFFTVIYGRIREESPFSQFSGTNRGIIRSNIPTPFPQCLTTEFAAQLLQPQMVQQIFDAKLTEEDRKFTQELNRNINLNNSRKRIDCSLDFNDHFLHFNTDDIMDFEEMQLRSDIQNGPLVSRAATKVAEEILHQYENR